MVIRDSLSSAPTFATFFGVSVSARTRVRAGFPVALRMADFPMPFAKKVCLCTGCNVAGLESGSFSAGNYTAQGSFSTMRMRVDQDTIQDLANRGNRDND